MTSSESPASPPSGDGAASAAATPRQRRWQALHAWTRSVRFLVTFWHTLTLAGILVTFSAVLYTTVAANLSRDVNRSLALLANGTGEALFAFWRAERAAAMVPGNWQDAPAPTFRSLVDSAAFPTLIGRWAEKTRALAGEHPVRVLSRGGQVLAASEGFQDSGNPADVTAATRTGQPVYDTVLSASGQHLRVITFPVQEDDVVLYALQVAASLESADASLERLRARLVWLVPLTLLLTGLLGWWLASSVLRPVGHMIEQVEGISTGRLAERIDVPETGDEIERLATTFNANLERMEGAFKRLRQFSAAASHELRTPLTAIRGELEVCLRRPRSPTDYQQVLQTQLEALEDLGLTVQELLALARDEAAQGSVDKQPMDCGALVRDVGQAWERLARSKHVRIEVQAEQAVWVLGERRLLERLVMNLLDNAVRHTPSGGDVTLSIKAHEGSARLIVQDTGPGIASADIPYLFDRFFKPRGAGSEAESTGLGLGLCRWIIEAHQGRIEVSNRLPQGAVFTVWLPLSDRPSDEAPAGRAGRPGRRRLRPFPIRQTLRPTHAASV